MPQKILIVEDNQDMRESLKTFLGEEGARVTAVASAEDAIDAVDEQDFDIAIVDINLPGKSGFSLIEYIREEGHVYPLIAMTARDGIVDKIKGFDLGLTDYIVKPFDLLELRARIRTHIKKGEFNKFKTENYELKPESFEFIVKGKKVSVTTLEMRLLEILIQNNHILVTVDDLIEHAWGDQPDMVNPPIRIHIANLRKKLGDTDFAVIRTIPGVGYIFKPSREQGLGSMERLVKNTQKKFLATIVSVVLVIVLFSWGILAFINTQQIRTTATINDVHSSTVDEEAFMAYLEEQKEFEAHFVTLANSVKQNDSDKFTQALALTSVVVVVFGVFVAVIAARRLMKPVSEAYDSQERFIQDAAHELRNPLAAMMAALQQANQNTPLAKTFRRQTKRLININEDLLFLERRSKQEPTKLNLGYLLEEVAEELGPLAQKNRVKIKLENGSDIEKVMAATDYVRLTKNIIDNAIKYSDEGSVVHIKQYRGKNSIHIVVKDHGIGIPKKDLENIGDRFFRASNTGVIDGTGLGLAIVQKILNTYGGSFDITSKSGKGTSVTVTLPA